jgi:sulfoquinovosyltransferase
VSGYSNRYQETFKYLKKAGDVCEIVTTDDVPDAPTSHQGYQVHNTPGFRFALYKHICLSMDLKLIAYNVMKVRPTHAQKGGRLLIPFPRPLWPHTVDSNLSYDDNGCVCQVFRPSVLHVASPGFFAIISTLYARLLKIPLVLSYHTHLPIYARYPTTLTVILNQPFSFLWISHRLLTTSPTIHTC